MASIVLSVERRVFFRLTVQQTHLFPYVCYLNYQACYGTIGGFVLCLRHGSQYENLFCPYIEPKWSSLMIECFLT